MGNAFDDTLTIDAFSTKLVGRMEQLILRQNKLTDSGVASLMAALAVEESVLVKIDLSINLLTSECAQGVNNVRTKVETLRRADPFTKKE